MAVQKSRKTPSKRGMHRSHDGLATPALSTDPQSRPTARSLAGQLGLPPAARLATPAAAATRADYPPSTRVLPPEMQSEADGATLPIRYEGNAGWKAKAVLIEGQSIGGLFDEYFKERTAEARKAIQGKYANRFKILEAERVNGLKAEHLHERRRGQGEGHIQDRCHEKPKQDRPDGHRGAGHGRQGQGAAASTRWTGAR